MFTNIGGKIKALAKVVCWIGIILSVIFGIISIVTGNEMSNSRYNSVDGSAMVTSGWTMRVHNVRMHENGKINWDWSEGGHFVRV